MPGKKSAAARKGRASARKGGQGPAAARASRNVPGFQTFVNNSAGPSARGVRVGFPAERTVDLLYVDVVTLTSAYGSLGFNQYRLNSVFDPDQTSTGHQPTGFDQWAVYYNHYVVERCDYEVEMLPTVPTHVGTYLSDDVTTPSDYSAMLELGGVGSAWNTNQPAHIFRGSVDIAKFFNRKNIASDSELRALVTANPAEEVYLTIRSNCIDAAVASSTTNATIRLKYKVRFMEPKDLPPSASRGPPTTGPPGYTACPDDQYEFVRVKRVEGSQFPSMKASP